jgi:NADH:ubiquinone reductase (H+-translocating)
MPETRSLTTRSTPKVVIIGGGFAGMEAAKALSNRQVAVTLIDLTNHHLFQPLLYQVATAGLNPADIAQPIRHILRNSSNIEVVLGEVTDIDLANRVVKTKQDRALPYDFLIVATGARHSYFGHDEWEAFAPGLKNLEDALELRRRILRAFEMAEIAASPEERAAAQTFVIVGAGPTGVEMAGAISELATHTLADDFRNIDPTKTRVILLDAAPRVLPTFAQASSDSALAQLREMHIEVRTNTAVREVNSDGVKLDTEFIPAKTIVWAAGNAASPLAQALGKVDRAGRVEINPDLSIPGYPEVFAVGDMALFTHQGGHPLPGVSPAAMQMGRRAATNILEKIAGRPTRRFHYFDKGSMATIGRNKAIADIRGIRFGGFLAWLAWLFVHLIFLVGFRNRLSVIWEWAWAYVTFGRGARLIYGTFRPKVAPPKQEHIPSTEEPQTAKVETGAQ